MWRCFAATHPQPSEASEAAGRAALELADASKAERRTAARVSVRRCVRDDGGAGARSHARRQGRGDPPSPAWPGLNIGELNLVRRHLSAIKGGQLAARAGRSVTLAISDVCVPVEDDPVVIGSGPTTGDDSTFSEAIDVLRRHDVLSDLPPAVVAHLEAGAAGLIDGPVPSSDRRLSSAAYFIVASRHDAMRAAADTARHLGYHTFVQKSPTVGEAREAARAFLDGARGLERPACVVATWRDDRARERRRSRRAQSGVRARALEGAVAPRACGVGKHRDGRPRRADRCRRGVRPRRSVGDARSLGRAIA